MNSNFNERVAILNELLNEGHITPTEFTELVSSLRGGAVNDIYDKEHALNIAGHAISLEEEYEREVNNPNKLEDYENFLSGGKNPLHNTFYHIVDNKEVEDSANRFMEMVNGPQAYHRINGLAKQDVHSGNIINGCRVEVDKDGKLNCLEPFHSYEYNTIPVHEHPAYDEIMEGLKTGKIVLS